MLSPSVQDYKLLAAAYILPPAIGFAIRFWVVKPLKKHAKLEKVILPAADSLFLSKPILKFWGFLDTLHIAARIILGSKELTFPFVCATAFIHKMISTNFFSRLGSEWSLAKRKISMASEPGITIKQVLWIVLIQPFSLHSTKHICAQGSSFQREAHFL